MTKMDPTGLRRRTFLGGASAASVGALLIGNGWADAAGFFTESGIDLDGLQRAGFDLRHTQCMQCGALCGLSALVKTNGKPGEKNFFIFGNQHPEHPQRGMCGRGAATSQTWNSSLRLKKPLKLVGPRGSGQFREISWTQALDEIAAKLAAIIEADGPRAVASTGHNLTTEVSWLTLALGSPNAINQASTCNTAGVVARRWMMGNTFQHHAVIDPDYERVRYILFPGRTLHAPIGAQFNLAKARARGARVAFLNPAHPDSAYAHGEWIPCKPGTDAAFLMGVSNVLVNEGWFDEGFARRFTNLPMMFKPDGHPLSAKDMDADGEANAFYVYDAESEELVAHDDEAVVPVLSHSMQVELADGSTIEVTTAWNLFVAHLANYTPQRVAAITDVPEATIRRVARDLHINRGVVEDTWYNTRNGSNDTDAIMAILTVNGLLGNFDKPGGMTFRPGHGMPGVIARDGEGVVTNRLGGRLELPPPGRRLDQQIYPESNGTFEAVVKSVVDGDTPYAIKALFLGDACVFQRDPNTRRIEEMLRKLELVVTIDILHHEACDWSDYVLPSDMFVEREALNGIGWTNKPAIAYGQPITPPPPGADVRPMEWILLEIVRRIYPERAEALKYTAEMQNPEVFKRDFLGEINRRRIAGAAERWNLDATELTEHLKREGFYVFRDVVYDVVPYKTKLASPSGKLEINAIRPIRLGYRSHGFAEHRDPTAYKLPAGGAEFYLVNGKSPAGSSGASSLSFSAQFIAENSIWINPGDAARLRIEDGDTIELTGLDTGWVARARAKVTPRVHQGTLFTYSYQGGNRQQILKDLPGFQTLTKGINPHWFATAHIDPTTGSGFNNASVRIRKVA